MLVLYVTRKVINKMPKYNIFFKNTIPIYLLIKLKSTKFVQQKNKPIKYNHIKKNNIKLLEEKKHLFLSP